MVKVACVQMRSGVDVSQNLETLAVLVANAVEQGAQYIQTPEMTSIIEKSKDVLFSKLEPDDEVSPPNSVVEFLTGLARMHKIWLHVGSIAVLLESGKAANRGFLISPSGERIAQYDKIHMFDVNLPGGERWRESSTYDAGYVSHVVELPPFRLGMSICYDVRFPHLYRHQAKAGAQVLTCPAAFTHQTGKAHWHILLRARAIENGAFMIASAQGGVHESGRHTFGHSMIINPWGEVIAELDHEEPGVLVCEIDLDEVDQSRARIPNLLNDARFALEKHGT